MPSANLRKLPPFKMRFGHQCMYVSLYAIPRPLYPTPFLGIFKVFNSHIEDIRHKARFPRKGVVYRSLGRATSRNI